MESYWSRTLLVYEESFWVGYFESALENGGTYRVARHIFGPEPSEAELAEFILSNEVLKVPRTSSSTVHVPRVPKNPKRLTREAAKTVQKAPGATRAREAVKEDRTRRKQERRTARKQKREEERERRYAQRQNKRKLKRRGH